MTVAAAKKNPSVSPLVKQVRDVQGYENAEYLEMDPQSTARSSEDVGALDAAVYGSDHFVTMFKRLPEEGVNVFKPTPILDAMVEDKRNIRRKNGERMFYMDSEMQLGWRIYNSADHYKYTCPLINCPKKLDSAKKLANHVYAYHPRDYENFYKDELILMVKEEMNIEGGLKGRVTINKGVE